MGPSKALPYAHLLSITNYEIISNADDDINVFASSGCDGSRSQMQEQTLDTTCKSYQPLPPKLSNSRAAVKTQDYYK